MQDQTVLTAVTIQPTGRTVSWIVRVLLICVTLGLDVELPINQVIQSIVTTLLHNSWFRALVNNETSLNCF